MSIEAKIKSSLEYNPATGEITWAVPKQNVKVGRIAGTVHTSGYIRIMFDDKHYPAHRIAWLLAYGEWPAGTIDHVNRNPADNRLENLREATNSQNMTNRVWGKKKHADWPRGVSKHRNRWQAKITVNGKVIHIGSFLTKEEAAAAFLAKATALRGDYLPKEAA